jgi:hypothetical protein
MSNHSLPAPGILPCATDSAEETGVYRVLASHQRKEDWECRDVIAFLQDWAERMIIEFKLDIPVVALCIDWLPANCYGHFRCHHNGFGLRNEIALNRRYLSNRPIWQILGTLAHELLHAWQEAHGTPSPGNHHNCGFRRKALALGLIINARGLTGYTSDGPFKELLHRNAIAVPVEEVAPPARRPRGNSKQKKWSCGCKNVWTSVQLNMRCLDCGNLLERNDSPGRAQRVKKAPRVH